MSDYLAEDYNKLLELIRELEAELASSQKATEAWSNKCSRVSKELAEAKKRLGDFFCAEKGHRKVFEEMGIKCSCGQSKAPLVRAFKQQEKELSEVKKQLEASQKVSDANNLLLEKYKQELDEWKCPRCKSAKEHDAKLRESSQKGLDYEDIRTLIDDHVSSESSYPVWGVDKAAQAIYDLLPNQKGLMTVEEIYWAMADVSELPNETMFALKMRQANAIHAAMIAKGKEKEART